VTAGAFFDCNRRFGLEASGFLLEQKSNISFYQSSPAGTPVLARPFIDSANVRAGSALVVSSPNLGSGSVLVSTSTRAWGVEGNGVINLYRTGPMCRTGCSVDFLLGVRYFELDETLNVSSQTTLGIPNTFTPVLQVNPFGVLTQVGAVLTPGSTTLGGVQVFNPASIEVRDSFKVWNQFYGGQIGLRTEWRLGGAYSLMVTGKFAMGDMHETIEVNGASGFFDPVRGQLGTAVGGLLANAGNIGRYHRDEFAIIPEVNASLGIAISQSITGYIGYNFLYVNKVARPGSQINPVVNTASVPFSPNYGTNRPFTTNGLFAQDDFWLMGVNFGLNFRY
jgi:hypothetical protein